MGIGGVPHRTCLGGPPRAIGGAHLQWRREDALYGWKSRSLRSPTLRTTSSGSRHGPASEGGLPGGPITCDSKRNAEAMAVQVSCFVFMR